MKIIDGVRVSKYYMSDIGVDTDKDGNTTIRIRETEGPNSSKRMGITLTKEAVAKLIEALKDED